MVCHRWQPAGVPRVHHPRQRVDGDLERGDQLPPAAAMCAHVGIATGVTPAAGQRPGGTSASGPAGGRRWVYRGGGPRVCGRHRGRGTRDGVPAAHGAGHVGKSTSFLESSADPTAFLLLGAPIPHATTPAPLDPWVGAAAGFPTWLLTALRRPRLSHRSCHPHEALVLGAHHWGEAMTRRKEAEKDPHHPRRARRAPHRQ